MKLTNVSPLGQSEIAGSKPSHLHWAGRCLAMFALLPCVVHAVDDAGLPAPVITFGTPSPSMFEGSTVLVDPEITVTDADSPTLASLSIRFSDPNIGSVVLDNDPATMGTIGVSWNRFFHAYSMAPAFGQPSTMAQWQAALRGLRFASGTVVDVPTPLTFDINASDEAGNITTASRTINVLPIQLTAPTTTVATAVNQPVTFSGGRRISFTDTGGYTGPKYVGYHRIRLQVAHGTLSVINTDGVMLVGANGMSDATFDGRWAGVDLALEGFVYTPTAGYEGADQLTVTVHTAFLSPLSGAPAYLTLASGSVPLQVGATPVSLQSFQVD